jgi:uncharacterized protein YgbK (DUF1537 family)
MSKPILGCIADDFTGATDLANNLVREGMRAAHPHDEMRAIQVCAAFELDA